jgi:ABC-2 type transport system permease protein
MIALPPFCWWLRNPVSRASFLLIAAYLVRDRDVKLRIYPGLAPILVVPLILLVKSRDPGGFGTTFTAAYLGLVPLLALTILQYSTQYQASDIFGAAPLTGPALICHGERCAVLIFFTVPLMILSTVVVLLIQRDPTQLLLLLPGFVAIPVFSLIPHLGGNAIPLSQPTDESKSARRGFTVIAAMDVSLAIAGIATFAWSMGWFRWLLLVEAPISLVLYLLFRRSVAVPWPSTE